MQRRSFLLALFLCVGPAVQAADVTNPEEVGGLMLDKSGNDVLMQWDPTLLDVLGNPETIGNYEVYSGTVVTFVPDKASGTNRIGSPTTAAFTDVGAIGSGQPDCFYLVSAVDQDGNEGATRAPRATTVPTLSGFWTDTTIELDWTAAQPAGEITSYRVYRGASSRQYDFVDDVSLVQAYSALGLTSNINYHFAVTAVDSWGNETPFSNEHIDPLGGTLTVTVHDTSALCWGASNCTPTDPTHVQRSNGFELLVPVEFPVGDWVSVEASFTMESRLCEPPAGDNITRCGSGNPCVSPPCNGGYNTCGDPWDRRAHLFMVLDDCITGGQGCINNSNLELIRTVTPFGTDADPPDGTGAVGPRTVSLDITPFEPLITGQQRYIGAHIEHYVQGGWWVSSTFTFSERPEDTSPKPPADGFQPVFFHVNGSAITGPFPTTIPAEADEVIGRLFITAHGGTFDPVCGAPADEFCQRTNRILVDGLKAWQAVPWRDCCWPRDDPNCSGCSTWNSCGYPSCTFDRSGWCPGELACHYNIDDGCDQDLPLTTWLVPGGTYDVQYEIFQIHPDAIWARSLMLYWYDTP